MVTGSNRPADEGPPSDGTGRSRSIRSGSPTDARSRLASAILSFLVLSASIAGIGVVAGDAATPSASFTPSVVTQEHGDTITITVHTSQAGTVNLGGPQVGFWLQFGVGGGTTQVRLDTYDVDDADGMITASKGSIRNVQLKTAPPTRPLDVATYPMNVTIEGREQGLGAFVITERAINGSDGLVVPQEVDLSKLETAGDVRGVATRLGENDTVAGGDWFVYRVNESGLGGHLSKGVLGGTPDHVSVEFVQRNPKTNEPPNRFSGDGATKLLVDPEAECFFLFVDAGNHGIEPGDVYDVAYTVDERNPTVSETETTNTTFEVSGRLLDLDGGNRISVGNETTLTGNTTLAPGSSIELRARHPGVPPILKKEFVTVSENRTIEATFDFTDVPTNMTFELRAADPELSIDAVKPEPPTPTPTPIPTTIPPPPSTTLPTPFPTTATPTSTPTPHPTARPITAQPLASSGGQPGMGLPGAVVALLAATLVALRRGGIGP